MGHAWRAPVGNALLPRNSGISSSETECNHLPRLVVSVEFNKPASFPYRTLRTIRAMYWRKTWTLPGRFNEYWNLVYRSCARVTIKRPPFYEIRIQTRSDRTRTSTVSAFRPSRKLLAFRSKWCWGGASTFRNFKFWIVCFFVVIGSLQKKPI